MAKIKGGYLQKCLSCEELFGAKEKGISYCPKCRIDLLREKRMGKIQKKEKRTCPQCGNIFETGYIQQRFCNDRCRYLFNKAKRPSTQEWQELVEYCLERDNFKCTECDSDINLVIHHIIPIYRCGSNKPNNLKTVCERCHQKLHLLLNSE